jgi:hypothetical protein
MLTRDDVNQFLRRNDLTNVDSQMNRDIIIEKKFTTYENWNKKNRNECSSTITKYEFPDNEIIKIFFNSAKDKDRHEKHLRKETVCAFEIRQIRGIDTLEFGIFLKCDYLTSGDNFFEIKYTSFFQLKVDQ